MAAARPPSRRGGSGSEAERGGDFSHEIGTAERVRQRGGTNRGRARQTGKTVPGLEREAGQIVRRALRVERSSGAETGRALAAPSETRENERLASPDTTNCSPVASRMVAPSASKRPPVRTTPRPFPPSINAPPRDAACPR
jgi:hypothetical protein